MNLIWFRQDLRLSDNPAFFNATLNATVLPIYIHDEEAAGAYKMGAASKVWLQKSLSSLDASLGGKLSITSGDALSVLSTICKRYDIDSIYWNKGYEPWRSAQDDIIYNELSKQGINCHIYNGSLLWEPDAILKSDGSFYKVFSAYYKNVFVKANSPRAILPPTPNPSIFKAVAKDNLNLLPKHHWYMEMISKWEVGESGAKKRLDRFLSDGLLGYKSGRNYPAKDHVSGLSPYLHFGEISPNQIWHGVRKIEPSIDVDCFLTELIWREFSYYLLFHFPELPKANFQKKYDNFPWVNNNIFFKKWCTGQTGYPIVDAGMRQLWQTGYMHNRVRMIVASFLVKNMMIDWRAGWSWFWDCLVDADLANNSASWQWVAGSGADAAPYFRIFNPILQAQKFDPHGEYIKRFVPELNSLPAKYIFAPWQAPEGILRAAGVNLDDNYPSPIIDLMDTRNSALAAYHGING